MTIEGDELARLLAESERQREQLRQQLAAFEEQRKRFEQRFQEYAGAFDGFSQWEQALRQRESDLRTRDLELTERDAAQTIRDSVMAEREAQQVSRQNLQSDTGEQSAAGAGKTAASAPSGTPASAQSAGAQSGTPASAAPRADWQKPKFRRRASDLPRDELAQQGNDLDTQSDLPKRDEVWKSWFSTGDWRTEQKGNDLNR